MIEKHIKNPARNSKKAGGIKRFGMVLMMGLLAFGLTACAIRYQPPGERTDASQDAYASTAPGVSASQSSAGANTSASGEEAVSVVAPVSLGHVTIDPGHGGFDPGSGEIGALEKDIVLAISLKLRDQLEQANVEVLMTRDTDAHVDLDDRAVVANDAQSDLFVSVHCNAFDGKARGLECYYYKSEQGKQLAHDITAQAAAMGARTREVRENGYQVLRQAKMPAVLVETGFLTDAEECAKLCDPEYQEKLAGAIAAAVLKALQVELA